MTTTDQSFQCWAKNQPQRVTIATAQQCIPPRRGQASLSPRTIPRPSNSASAPQPRATVQPRAPDGTNFGPDPLRWTRRLMAPAEASAGIPRSCGHLNAEPVAAQRDDGVHDAARPRLKDDEGRAARAAVRGARV